MVLSCSTLLGGSGSSRVNGRTLRVKNCKLLALGVALLAVALTGCKDKDPFVDPGDTPNPNWTVTVENDMTSSMTMIVKVYFTEKEGTLAAFMGNDCCGVADYLPEEGLYNLYISPAADESDVQLRFYSPDLKRIFEAKETFAFRNEAHEGTISEPYTPEWVVK